MNTPSIQKCQLSQIAEICASFNNDPGELINVLHKTQGVLGYLPEEAQKEVALRLGIPFAKVYGIVTFYSFFTMSPKGKYAISVCMGTACYVRGADKVVEEIKSELGINVGEVTRDGKFSLDCLRCVGACGLAPVVLIGEKVYGRLEPGKIREIISEYKAM